MALPTLAEIESAYAALQTIFKTDVGPRTNALIRQVDNGATLDDIQGELNSLRAEFDNAYARIEELLTYAKVIEPRPDDLIARLTNSFDVNRPRNLGIINNIETDARANQQQASDAVEDRAASDQGSQTDSAGSTVDGAQQARDDGALTQNPENRPLTDAGPSAVTNALPVVTPQPDGILSAGRLPNPAAGNAGAGGANGISPGSGTPRLTSPSGLSVDQTYIYKATSVTSRFSKGQFTQDLEGVLLIFPADAADTSSSATAGSAANRTQTENAGSAPLAEPADGVRAATDVGAALANRVGQNSLTNQNTLSNLGVGTASRALNYTEVDINNAVTNSISNLTGLPTDTAQRVNTVVQGGINLGLRGPPTSAGQVVGLVQQIGAQASAAVNIQTQTVTVTTFEGERVPVTAAQQALSLYSGGRISLAERDRALAELSTLTAAQRQAWGAATQNIKRES